MTDEASAGPGSGAAGASAVSGDEPRARAPVPVSTLKKRADFLAAARARRWATPGVIVQGRERGADEAAETPVRVGFTCSKKVGGAVRRNRAKRRLRAAAAAVLPHAARPGWDYVLIGLAEATAARPFAALKTDLYEALERLHAGKGREGGPPRRRRFGRGKGARV